ncbi:hypothetical protein M3202_01495 [Alkalihalobacillus oceani]|uniref:Uncharacterized protein n=1 Tax=Halalkalibacter oceani TaxID=1653776 RepID=A0A9X2ILD6_9BACI|nr:hypothetical protein [Halalkalibacter oceani]MCM3712744.1 hypothetical protein [Halalkalibacter oceani]
MHYDGQKIESAFGEIQLKNGWIAKPENVAVYCPYPYFPPQQQLAQRKEEQNIRQS